MSPKQYMDAILQWSQQYTKTDMRYIVRGGFWLMSGKIGVFLVSLVTVYAFANWVPKEIYGTYQYILGIMGIFSIATLPGVTLSLINAVAKAKDGSLVVALRARMRWGAIGSIGLFSLSIWYFIQTNTTLGVVFVIAACALPLYNSFDIFHSYWNGRKDFKKRTLYMILSTLGSTLIFAPTLFFTDNIIIIMAIFFATSIILNGLFLILTMRKIRNREIDTAVVSFGKTMTAIQAVNTLANYLDRVIAWKFLGPVAVATYSLAKLPVDKLNQLTPVNILALPKLSEGEIDFQKRKGILSKFLRLFVFFIPAALLVALLGPFLYRIVFPLYVDSVGYFQALTVLMAFVPFSLLYSVLVAEMRKRELYIVQISSPALKIIGLVILAPFYGIWGMIIAILGSEFLRGMMMLFFFLRSYKKTRP